MKSTTQTFDAAPGANAVVAAVPAHSLAAGLAELFKARLTTLVLLTTYVGFYAGSRGPVNRGLMLGLMAGTALLASGASALNQLLERDLDAKMRRTRNRPLPSGQMTPEAVLVIGGLCSAAGLVCLALTVNLLAAALGVVTLFCYVGVYTPLKRVTPLNTIVGAVPGALPPLIGWAAARGNLSVEGWVLFAILFFWQLPHFFAIAWMYREDYAGAGFVMLPAVDLDGARTGRQAFSHTLGLLPLSLAPYVLGLAGPVYAAGAAVLGSCFLVCAWQFMRQRTALRAKALFYASIAYLPLLLGLMVFDKRGG